jgi:hypothetical protein
MGMHDGEMSAHLSPVLSSEDLPLAELYAARLDGELVAIDNYFFPIDEPDDLRHRTRLLAAMVPVRMIAEQHSAAWAWGVRDLPPVRHQFCVATQARVSVSVAAPHRLREVVIDNTEIACVGGLALTTPLRTAIDIARNRHSYAAIDREVVASLMTLGGFGAEDCLRAMNKRRNLPQKNEALVRLHVAEQRTV